MAKYYKWTAGGKPIWGTGEYDFSGAWMPKIEKLKLGKSGYHAVPAAYLGLTPGTELWEIEVRGESLAASGPYQVPQEVWSEIRFVRQAAWGPGDLRDYADWLYAAIRDFSQKRVIPKPYLMVYVATLVSWTHVPGFIHVGDFCAASRAAHRVAISQLTLLGDEVMDQQRQWVEARIGQLARFGVA